MGYRLRMSGEIHDWLAELVTHETATASRVIAALTALLTAGEQLGPPTVVPLADPPLPPHPPDALDTAYQRYLHRLARGRRRGADARVSVKRAELQIAGLESQQANLTEQRRQALAATELEQAGQIADQIVTVQEELAGLRRELPRLTEAEREILSRVQRLQRWVDAFRVRKEMLKASYIAAQSLTLADELTGEMRDAEDATQAEGAGQAKDAAQGEDVSRAEGDAPGHGVATAHDGGAAREQKADEAKSGAARLAEIEDQIRDALRATPLPGDGSGLWPAVEPGLSELRPSGDDVRILFAVEPAGTALLIAVLDGDDAVAEHYDEAVSLASEQLRQVRAGLAPEASAYGYADADALTGEFFPAEAGQILGAAADLVSGNRVHTLAGERIRLGLTQELVAARMGVPEERIPVIERAGPDAVEVGTLASYVAALGGRLELVADFDDERVKLR